MGVYIPEIYFPGGLFEVVFLLEDIMENHHPRSQNREVLYQSIAELKKSNESMMIIGAKFNLGGGFKDFWNFQP